MLPKSIIGAGLTANEIAVCAVIGHYRNGGTGESFPGMARIAAESGMSKPTAIAAVKGLREKGIITVRVEQDAHKQRFVYRLPGLDHESETGNQVLPVNYKTGQSDLPVVGDLFGETGKKGMAKPVKPVDPNKTINKKEEKPYLAKSETATPDPRSAEFKTAIGNYWESKNENPITWDASEGKALKQFLSANPKLTVDQFTAMLRNRYKSDDNHADRPRMWLGKITSYGAGPLDKYGKPKGDGSNGTGRYVSPAASRQRESDRNIYKAFEILAGAENANAASARQLLGAGDHDGDGDLLAGRMGAPC